MGSKTRDVYDFLLSIDYAWCHGPVDSINQIWIKDKPIWCGQATSRRNIHVRLPELFGGDNEGEGGVEGCVEFYPGSYSQFMSQEYATRFPDPDDVDPNADYDQMPGYRGICHTFFRGGPGLTGAQYQTFLASILNNPDGYDPTNPEAATSEAAEVTDTIIQDNFESGFKWASNNPYLGDTKASISRFPDVIPGAEGTVKILSQEPGASALVRQYEDDPKTVATKTADLHLDPGDDAVWTPFDTHVSHVSLASTVYAHKAVYYLPFDQQTINDNKVSVSYTHTFKWGEGSSYHTFSFESNFAVPGYGAVFPDDWGPAVDDGGFFGHEYVGPGLIYSPGQSTYSHVGLWPHGWAAFSLFGGTRVITGSASSPASQAIFTYYPYKTHCSLEGGSYLLGDANPAQIIYELLTNAEWGAGEPVGAMGTSWAAAATTLFNENFGLGFIWTRQSEVKEFIQEIIDHVRAFVYIDPQTGLWEIKLLRDDYTTVGLDVLDPTNCDLVKYGRRGWGDIVNEITVSYTDPETEEDATVSSHEPGALAMTGQVIPETRNYHGVRSEALAQWIADRDIAEAAYPAFTATAEVSRAFWATTPGAVLKLTWPEEGIDEMIVRVMNVDYGKPKDRTIRLELIEDVFGREQTSYTTPQGSLWESGERPPQDLPYQQVIEAPLPILQLSGFDEADVDTNNPGDNYLIPLGWDDTRFVSEITVSQVADTGANTAIGSPSVVQPVKTNILTADMDAEVRSTLPASQASFLTDGAVAVGSLFLLTPADGGTDEDTEIIYVEAYDGSDWTVLRGVWDTQPRDWVAGDRIWRLPKASNTRLATEFATGDDVYLTMQSRSSGSQLGIIAATRKMDSVSGRAHQPFAPKNLTIIETLSGDPHVVDFTETVYDGSVVTLPTSFDLEWSNRNRTTEEDAPMAYDDGTVTVESGQTTTVRIVNTVSGALIEEHTGETGTTFTLAVSAAMQDNSRFTIQLVAVHDGEESLQPAEKKIWLLGDGWGYSWNEDWGNP